MSSLVTVTIAGVDRTKWVMPGMRRSAQVGSRATLTFSMNNLRGDYRPAIGDAIVVHEKISGSPVLFFLGLIDSFDENATSGTSGFYSLDVRCLDYGAMLDRRIIARTYPETRWGGIAGLIAADVIQRFLSDLGITGPSWPSGTAVDIGSQTFNWVTATAAFQQMADAQNWDWRLGFDKVLHYFDRSAGYADCPFTVATNNHKWRSMQVTHGGAYRNKQYVRNSQDFAALWTDRASADGTQVIFPTMVELTIRPVLRIDGTEKIVDDVSGGPGDAYWLPASVVTHSAPTAGQVVDVIYPSPLSFVAIAQDDTAIAARGLQEAVDEVKDVPDAASMGVIAAGFLARGSVDSVSVTIESDEPGAEPGQLLTIDTLRPPVNDSFLIEQVDSEEIGRREGTGFFRHTIRASNTQLQRQGSGVAFFQRLLDQAQQPRDRTTYTIGFTLAETIEGITNPGLTAGLKQATRTAPKDGIASQCTIYFNSVNASPLVLTTTDVSIDLLKNGTSIFGTTKLVWPAGATTLQVRFVFASNPLQIRMNDIFSINVLSADPAAKDGALLLTVLG
jgi:hypothetical protein